MQKHFFFLAPILIFFFLVITYLIYMPGLAGPFLLDDMPNLEVLQFLENPSVTISDIVYSNVSGPLGRPISMLTFIMDYQSNGLYASAFKTTNLLIHLLTGLLVCWLSMRIFQGYRFSIRSEYLAVFVSACWLLAPLLVSTVLYPVQRMAQLSTLFVLAGCLSYVIGRQNLTVNSRLALLGIVSSVLIFLPLAVFSKENGILLIPLIMSIEIYIFQLASYTNLNQKIILRKIYSVIGVLMVSIGTLVLFLKWGSLMEMYVKRDYGWIERLLTQSRILVDYMLNLLLPNPAKFGLYHDDIIVSTNLYAPLSTLFSAIFILGLVIFAIAGAWSSRQAIRLLAFGLMFFFIGHSLESTILPLELYFEHRNYLPAVGLFFSLAIALTLLYENVKLRAACVVMALILLAIYAVMTNNRSTIWQSYDGILYSASLNHSESLRFNMDVAAYYLDANEIERARYHLKRVAEINPKFTIGANVQLAATYCQNKEILSDQYVSELNRLIAAYNFETLVYFAGTINYLTKLIEYNRCDKDLIKPIVLPLYNLMMRLKLSDTIQFASYSDLMLRSVQFLQTMGFTDQAITLAAKSYQEKPDDLRNLTLYLNLLLTNGKFNQANDTMMQAAIYYENMDNLYTTQIKLMKSFLNQKLREGANN